jgi:protein-S-isoprenylcysteine O-methyltransferase Ste14
VRHPFRRKNLSPRLLPLYLLAAGVFVLAKPTPTGFAVGSIWVIGGLALRGWGAGHLVKNDRLTISGPYAHLRHPLYAGTGMLGIGFAIIAGGPALALLLGCFAPLFLLYYLPYKERIESARLERRYGSDYAAYRAEVPALLPALSAWTPPPALVGGWERRWSRECFRANNEPGTVLGVGFALALLALRPILPL